MTDVAIVSTARTGLAKSWKGAFNMTYGATLAAHSIEHAVKRAGIDPAEVEDVILGAANLEGTTGGNVARVAALRAGLPVTTSGVSINRFCSSGLQAIAMAAQRIALLMAPVAPHLAEQLWRQLGHDTLAAEQPWPTWDEAALAVDEIEIAIQVGGKVRERIMVGVEEDEESVKSRALAEPRIAEMLTGKTVRKVVYVKHKLVNIVA